MALPIPVLAGTAHCPSVLVPFAPLHWPCDQAPLLFSRVLSLRGVVPVARALGLPLHWMLSPPLRLLAQRASAS